LEILSSNISSFLIGQDDIKKAAVNLVLGNVLRLTFLFAKMHNFFHPQVALFRPMRLFDALRLSVLVAWLR